MKLMIVPALALAGAVGYGTWSHHHLDVRAHLIEETQQNNIAEVTSLSDSVAQRKTTLQDPTTSTASFDGSFNLRSTTLDDHLTNDTIDRNAHSLGQRLDKLGSDATSTRSALAGYQDELRETHELFEGYISELPLLEKVGHSIARGAEPIITARTTRLFQQKVDRLYTNTWERVDAAAARRANEDVERPVVSFNYREENSFSVEKRIYQEVKQGKRYAFEEVILQVLVARDAETLYMLHLKRPSAASPETFQQEVRRFAELCDTVGMTPTTNYKLAIDLGMSTQDSILGPKGTKYRSEHYMLFEGPFVARHKCAFLTIEYNYQPNTEPWLDRINYSPPKH